MGLGGAGHWLILLVIVVILFGGRKLPELGKGLGEAIRGFKKGLGDNEIDVTETAKQDKLKDGDEKKS